MSSEDRSSPVSSRSTFGLGMVTTVPSVDTSDAVLVPASSKVQQLLADLQQLPQSSQTRLQQLGLLAVSLVLFLSLGLLQWSVPELLLIVVVLLVHEGGHYAAMTAFGYRDVKMFFIPLFGAAVSGSDARTAPWKRTIVALAGPVPGLVLGTILAAAFLVTRDRLIGNAAWMFLVLNGFNLLPILPLDGGHVLQETLFCRNRYLEAVFRFLAAGALLVLGFTARDLFVSVLGVLALKSAFGGVKLNGIVVTLRGTIERPNLTAPDQSTLDALELISGQVDAAFPDVPRPTHAGLVRSVIEKLTPNPPGVGATILLLSVYGAAFLTALVGIVLTAAGHQR